MSWRITRIVVASLMVSAAVLAQDAEPKDLIKARAEYVTKLSTFKQSCEKRKDDVGAQAYQAEIENIKGQKPEKQIEAKDEGIAVFDDTPKIETFEFVDRKNDKMSNNIMKPSGVKDLKFRIVFVLPQDTKIKSIGMGMLGGIWNTGNSNLWLMCVENSKNKKMVNKDYARLLGTISEKTEFYLYIEPQPQKDIRANVKASVIIEYEGGTLKADYFFDKNI